MAEGGHNGASFYPASPPNTMAMSQGYPAYMSLASAVRQPYTPQVNHSYAMPSANQQLQQQLQDDLETASHASGTSGRSRGGCQNVIKHHMLLESVIIVLLCRLQLRLWLHQAGSGWRKPYPSLKG